MAVALAAWACPEWAASVVEDCLESAAVVVLVCQELAAWDSEDCPSHERFASAMQQLA